MEQLHFITKLLDIKDPNIHIMDVINRNTLKEIIAIPDDDAPDCPDCGSLMKKYDFQKPSKIPYLKTTGIPTRILLRKRRFKCYQCSKIAIAETYLVKKITKFLVSSTKRLLKSWLKRLLWPTLLINFPSQLQLSFASSMISTLSMIFIVFLRLCPGMLKQSGKGLFQSGDEDEFHCSRFWQTQHHYCS